MSTFVSATTKSFNISPIPVCFASLTLVGPNCSHLTSLLISQNPRSTLDNPVRFEVSKHEFVDPEPECDCKEVKAFRSSLVHIKKNPSPNSLIFYRVIGAGSTSASRFVTTLEPCGWGSKYGFTSY